MKWITCRYWVLASTYTYVLVECSHPGKPIGINNLVEPTRYAMSIWPGCPLCILSLYFSWTWRCFWVWLYWLEMGSEGLSDYRTCWVGWRVAISVGIHYCQTVCQTISWRNPIYRKTWSFVVTINKFGFVLLMKQTCTVLSPAKHSWILQ